MNGIRNALWKRIVERYQIMPSCVPIFKGGQKMICFGVLFTPDIYANVHLIAWFFD